ncbi:hypothetical protein THAOC_31256 [Thalassiosira oceanica]|uniref:Uncharacterized protein n=1 Tax=Thalassiosira oceanica TaxID=159749 RepID=K0R8J5_THAOC|nr:hypothetical protein THAOC_31256 [Thalassiosira oceanica]|eukprot:EJK49833.1 hypothetical protein THAOC_31256 [Thalassiosira oceanica]
MPPPNISDASSLPASRPVSSSRFVQFFGGPHARPPLQLCTPKEELQSLELRPFDMTPALLKLLAALACVVTFGQGFITVDPSATSRGQTRTAMPPKRVPVSTSSRAMALRDDDNNVKVNSVEVDAFTLTAVGFGLIAFNFLVLAKQITLSKSGWLLATSQKKQS